MYALWVIGLYGLFLLNSCESAAQQCKYNYNDVDKSSAVEVFWINMDKSVSRRHTIEAHLNQLGILHRRIKGLSLDDIYIPDDILNTWNTYDAQIGTQESIPSTYKHKETKEIMNFTHVMSGLVGRVKGNRLKEIGCTSSHLEAMRQAVFFNRTSSPYALITEDDIYIPFNIDFNALVASAPKDFGILQLFNSNKESMWNYWKHYLQKKELWTQNLHGKASSFWSTCAYLINREVLRPIIEKIAYPHGNKVHLKVVAGIERPCRPKLTDCCHHIPGTSSYAFQHRPPCFVAPKGFQADSFLYALNKTYVITTPFITNGNGGNESTFHQYHVETIHFHAFQQQRQIINDMITGKAQLPPFLSIACNKPLELAMQLKFEDICSMPSYLDSGNISQVNVPLYILQPFFRYKFITSNYNPIHNKFPHVHRMNFTNSQRLFIPTDIADDWHMKECRLFSTELNKLSAANLEEIIVENDYEFVVSGLCGRKRSSFDDLVRTVSHLRALAHALENYPNDPYLLLTESHGDILTPFDIDIANLIKSAPEDFVMLKLFNSDLHSTQKYRSTYTKNQTWIALNEKIYDESSTKLYLVNMKKLKLLLPSIIQKKYTVSQKKVYYDVKIIAGLSRPCTPTACCTQSTLKTETFSSSTNSPCILSPGGVQAERWLWKLGPTYALTLPLWTAVMTDYQQGQVHLQQSFQEHRVYMNQLITGSLPLPSFAQKICSKPVPNLQ